MVLKCRMMCTCCIISKRLNISSVEVKGKCMLYTTLTLYLYTLKIIAILIVGLCAGDFETSYASNIIK